MSNIVLGLKLMGYGLGLVFMTLILFYFIIKIFVAISKKSAKAKKQG